MTYEELKAVFDARVRKLKPLKKYDIVEINRQMSKIMGEIISENVFEIEDVAEACKKILREYFDYANEVNARLQRKYDEKNGLNIAPQKAEFPTERVSRLASSLADPTVPPETIKRRASSAVENVAKSFHDNFVRKNAEFRSKAGVKCYIVRETSGNCCAWCSSLAGRYEYVDTPEDVFHRHNDCDCTLTFENGRERQNVWNHNEKWTVSPFLKVPYKPITFDRNKAKNTQKEKLAKYIGLDKSKKRLTSGENGDIINIASNAHSRNIELENTIKRCINSELPIFADDLVQGISKIKPPHNEYVVGLHGSDTNTWIFGIKIDTDILANIIKARKDYNGEDIYLFSCNTGNTTNTENCFAQLLADKLGVTVYAPTEYGVVWSNGRHYSGKRDFTPSGEIKPFKPRR